MSIARKDDRHNEDLVKEIAEGFDRAIGSRQRDDDAEGAEPEQERPRFTVTGDLRNTAKKRRE